MKVTYGKSLIKGVGVGLSYQGKQIHRDLNFEIVDIIAEGQTKGQIVALLGPSGIGKTQLMRLIAGSGHPTAGSILIDGKPPVPGKVGVVAQDYPLFEHLTVYGNLLLAAKQNGFKDKAEEKTNEWLERFGLLASAKMYPAQLSGGQRQRVAVAQQMLCSEHYIIMDEPFSGLDVINLHKVAQSLTAVANADELNTIIVVTHDVSAAVMIADTIWLMGFEKDAMGNFIPGAKIVKTYDLISAGLAWVPGVEETDTYALFVRDLKKELKTLAPLN